MTIQAASDAMPAALAPFSRDWADPSVEDIFVVGPGGYFVRRGATTEYREAPELDALATETVAVLSAHLRGQDVGPETPILDCTLASGERLNAIFAPCTPAGSPSLAIRRASATRIDFDRLEAQGFFQKAQARVRDGGETETVRKRQHAERLRAEGRFRELLDFAVDSRWTTVWSGMTGSGKTSNMKAQAQRIPPTDRVITVGNADELSDLPHPNRLNLLYSKGGPVKMEALVEAALRNGPRWLLVQEVRGQEAFSFLWAAATGHPGITSVHAPSAQETLKTLAINIKMHPEGATMDEETVQGMLRLFIQVIIHVERQPDGQFSLTDVRFGWEQN